MADGALAELRRQSALATKMALPSFSKNASKGFLRIMNHGFDSLGITEDEVKSQLLISRVPAELGDELSHLLSSPAPRYEDICARLLKLTCRSKTQKHHDLLDIIPIGDRRPSSYLKLLQDQMEDATAADAVLLRTIFIRGLQPEVKAQLREGHFAEIDALAEEADDIYESVNRNKNKRVSTIAADQEEASWTSAGSSSGAGDASSHHNSRHDELLATIKEMASAAKEDREKLNQSSRALEDLRAKMDHLSFREEPPAQHFQRRYRDGGYTENYRPDGRGSGRQWNERRSFRDRAANQQGYCSYHADFGERARNCNPPCSFKRATPSRGQGNL